MSAQNGTSHSNATKVIDPPKKEQNLTKDEEAKYLEKTLIPVLKSELREAQKTLEKLKKEV